VTNEKGLSLQNLLKNQWVVGGLLAAVPLVIGSLFLWFSRRNSKRKSRGRSHAREWDVDSRRSDDY
jgi:hypothetical protein